MATHRINLAELELQVGEVALAEHLIERVSLLRERRIAPLIDRVCSELSGPEARVRPGRPEHVVRIEQLELDLGPIALDDFDDDFLRKLEAALRAALSKRLAEQHGAEPPEHASIELLEIFARTGNLPWWADRGEPEPIASHVRVLLAAAPHELMRLVRALADDEPALTRIARHCGDALLDEIVGAMHAGASAGAELLAGIHELERLIAGSETAPGRANVIRARSAVLAALACTDTREPARALGAVLRELARSSPALRDALVAGELPATPSLREAMARAHAGLAPSGHQHAVDRDRDSVDARTGAGPAAARAREGERLDAGTMDERAPRSSDDRPLTHERPVVPELHAALSGERSGDRVEPDELAHLAGETSSSAVTGDAAFIDATSRDTAPAPAAPAFATRMAVSPVLAPASHAPTALASPAPVSPAPASSAPTALASPAPVSPAPASSAPTTPASPVPVSPAPTSLAHAPAAPALATPALAVPAHTRESRELAAARRRALDQLDELYVDDAGLVILWPFLDRFFLHVGLINHDRRFTDEQAPMQAISLLSQLAIEDPEPPEFRLPLAKLLCGLPPEAPFTLERPLTPEQLAECERLLAAVIDHTSILRDMPVASFRATFLQRPGVLFVRDGAWLLKVERQSHDLVLDRFPWSWSWVKLPWMPDPLRVEW
jgi:hypothetical protein